MRIYVACPWVRREKAVETAEALRAHGYEVCSRWHDNTTTTEYKDPSGADAPFAKCRDEANNDIEDVTTADVLLVLNLEKSEGKAVEQGIALAFDIPIIIVGERSNVFQYLPSVTVVSNFHDVLMSLQTQVSRLALSEEEPRVQTESSATK